MGQNKVSHTIIEAGIVKLHARTVVGARKGVLFSEVVFLKDLLSNTWRETKRRRRRRREIERERERRLTQSN